ncbi:MAG: RNA methyltransferase [Chloroflexi bacterium]|nr:RNA methyltransferase [Chloroflexota bacterium]
MPLQITSLQNPRVKQVVRLRDKRDRIREWLMLVEGRDELLMALESGAVPRTCYYCPAQIRDADQAQILARLAGIGAELVEVAEPVFAKMAYRENPDGWLAVFPRPDRTLSGLRLPPAPLLVVAEAVEKPGNLGAILRSADAAGVDAVLVCDPVTDVSNPNVVRASRGTVFTVPVVESPAADAFRWLRERGIRIVAATPHASIDFTAADLRGSVAIAVGAEDMGLSPLWMDGADVAVRIPMRGRVNSLNVATSATLMMYEALRQRSTG